MNYRSIWFSLTLLCGLICCPAVLQAVKMEPLHFRYSANLKGEVKKGGFYRIILPVEILERCEKSCKDIRLFDNENREIPFVILENRIPAKKAVQYPLDVVSYNGQAEKTGIVLKRTSYLEPVNRMELESPDRDFNKTVSVWGSADMKNWKPLGQEAIYDFSSRVNLRKMYVALGENSYPYFRLTIDEGKEKTDFKNIRLIYDGIDFSTSTYTKKKLKITRFVVLNDIQSQEKVVYDDLKILPSVSTDTERRITEIPFSTTLPFSAVEFVIDNPYYYRKIKLYGTNTNRKDNLVLINQDALYSLPISNLNEAKKSINFLPPQEYRSYKIVIENQSNPPLKIESIILKWGQKQLFFIGLDDQQEYRLCCGSPTVEEVSYDIAKMVRADNWFTQPSESLKISTITQNTNYKPFKLKGDKTLLEKNIFVIVLVLVVMVVAFFLFQLWKKTG